MLWLLIFVQVQTFRRRQALRAFAQLLPLCSRHSSYLSLPPLPAVVYFFQVSVLFSIENARLWPIKANFGSLSKIYTLFFLTKMRYGPRQKYLFLVFGKFSISLQIKDCTSMIIAQEFVNKSPDNWLTMPSS